VASVKALRAGLKAGNLKFVLKGKKLKGEFALVKIKGKAEENVWLLIKHRDQYAVDEYDSEKETPKNSPINKWLAENKTPVKKKSASAKSIASPVKKKFSRSAEKAGN
jgi:bifunctional non-homologous end joining protein LigD